MSNAIDAKEPVRIFSLKYCSIVAPFVVTSSNILKVFELLNLANAINKIETIINNNTYKV